MSEKLTQEERKRLKFTNLLWRCALSRHLADRIELIKVIAERFEDVINMSENLVDKLSNAAQTIKQQNEWIDCLYLAAQDSKNDIIEKAVLIQKGIEIYKKNKERFRE